MCYMRQVFDDFDAVGSIYDTFIKLLKTYSEHLRGIKTHSIISKNAINNLSQRLDAKIHV
jgi:hypothetical protein